MDDLENRVRKLETVIEYLLPASKNINKQLDSFADEFQQHSENYTEALGDIQNVKNAVMRYFINSAGNYVEDNPEYRNSEGLDGMPIQDTPLCFDDMMKDMCEEQGIDFENLTEAMFFKNSEDMDVFHDAYTMLATINPMLDPQVLYDTITNYDI